MSSLVLNSIRTLLNLFTDPSDDVRIALGDVLTKIFSNYTHYLITKPELFKELIRTIIKEISENKSHSKEISYNLINSISALANSAQIQENKDSCKLFKLIKSLFVFLFQRFVESTT